MINEELYQHIEKFRNSVSICKNDPRYRETIIDDMSELNKKINGFAILSRNPNLTVLSINADKLIANLKKGDNKSIDKILSLLDKSADMYSSVVVNEHTNTSQLLAEINNFNTRYEANAFSKYFMSMRECFSNIDVNKMLVVQVLLFTGLLFYLNGVISGSNNITGNVISDAVKPGNNPASTLNMVIMGLFIMSSLVILLLANKKTQILRD